MAELAMKLGDKARALKEYQLLLDSDHTNIDAARRLLQIGQEAGDEAAQTFALARIVALDPFDASAHVGWGQIALKRKDSLAAIREFRAALATGAPDKAARHCDLGESYLLAGQKAEAKKQALLALELAPSYERAQELLLNARTQ
jgi:tetratricopeptide (TPR) repeat protein